MSQENFIERAREELTPEVIRRLGEVLDEPQTKIQQDIQHILPTVLIGIIEEGTTLRGAKRMANLLNESHPSIDSSLHLQEESELQDGEKVTENLFGNRYYEFSQKLIPHSGLRSRNLEKLLGLITPLILGVLKRLLPGNKYRPFVLYRFLRRQKREQRDYYVFEAGENLRPRRQVPFPVAILLILLIFYSFFILVSKRNLSVNDLEGELKKIERLPAVTTPPTIRSLNYLISRGGDAPLGGRFALPTVIFFPQSTEFKKDGERDLKLLTNLLKENPRLFISILAASEDTGDSNENLRISEGRAMLVREELIGRGIEPSRIRARGSEVLAPKHQILIEIEGVSP